MGIHRTQWDLIQVPIVCFISDETVDKDPVDQDILKLVQFLSAGDYILFHRSYTSIGRLSADNEHVLSMTDGQLMLTYRAGNNCGGGRRSETIIILHCDEQAVVISF